MADIKYQVTLTVPGGPQKSLADVVKGDTYTKSDFKVPGKQGQNAGTASINVAGGAAEKLVLLLITAAPYSSDLSFKLDANDVKSFALTGPFAVIGSAAAQMLESDPNTLVFSNEAAQEAAVEILVARNASS